MGKGRGMLVVYSSRETGNTKKLAEALAMGFGCEAFPADEAPSAKDYDFVLLGFGVYRGWPDAAMRSYMSGCAGADVGIFLTLGTWPDSEHAWNCMGRAEGLLHRCRVRSKFICHGRLDPAMVERMKARPAGSPHSWDPERAERVTAAETHPDAGDVARALEVFRAAWEKLRDGATAVKTGRGGILLAAFGSTVDSGRRAYAVIEEAVKHANPEADIRWAYGSRMVRERMRAKGETPPPSVRGALDAMLRDGIDRLTLFPLYMVAGEEYHKVVSEVKSLRGGTTGFAEVTVMPPLLSSSRDINILAETVRGIFGRERDADEALVLMGHGNAHGNCSLSYLAAAHEFNRRDRGMFLALVEGHPDFPKVLKELLAAGFKKALVAPFMMVAGDHALNDMAGDSPDSWKSQLLSAGIEVRCLLKGLGEYPEIAELLTARTH